MFKSKSVLRVAAALLLTAAAAAKTATAAPIHPDEITVEVGDGANSAGPSYKDDVFLKTLVFDGTNYAYGTQIVSISEFEVLSGRKNINAEWGDWTTLLTETTIRSPRLVLTLRFRKQWIRSFRIRLWKTRSILLACPK